MEATSNATLASQLKKLGLTRGSASWDKSKFTKSLWVEADELRFAQRLDITVTIVNEAWFGETPNWAVRKVTVKTGVENGNGEMLSGSFDLTEEALELIQQIKNL